MAGTAGSSGLPYMHIETLRGMMKKFTTPPNLKLQKMFPVNKADSDLIVWESQTGSRGMANFKAPGAITEKTAPLGTAEHEAKAAFWGEKMDFDEEFLNNIAGGRSTTTAKFEKARQVLARNLRHLSNRCDRRKEWMFAQMLTAGTFAYTSKGGGLQISVDYAVPSANKVTIASGSYWTGASQTTRDIMGDIQAGKQVISDACGGTVNAALCSRTTLGYLAADSSMRDLLSKVYWNDGGLYKGKKDKILAVNTSAIADIIDIPNLLVYDEKYEVRSMLTTTLATDGTSAYVADAGDFGVGNVTFTNIRTGYTVTTAASAVVVETGIITITAVGGSTTFPAQQTIVSQLLNFIPDKKFVMMATSVEGEPIAAYEQAPFGNGRHYGMKLDKKEQWDPEAVTVRAQDKGLPILKQNDAVYMITVAP
jgi:hypothetical protein